MPVTNLATATLPITEGDTREGKSELEYYLYFRASGAVFRGALLLFRKSCFDFGYGLLIRIRIGSVLGRLMAVRVPSGCRADCLVCNSNPTVILEVGSIRADKL